MGNIIIVGANQGIGYYMVKRFWEHRKWCKTGDGAFWEY